MRRRLHASPVAMSPKLWHSLDLISGSRWPKAVAKSCGGHIQSIPDVIQAVANLSSYSLHSKRLGILGKDGFRVSSMSVKSGEKFFFTPVQVAGGLTCFMCHFPFAQVFKPSARSAGLFEFCAVFLLDWRV